MSKILIFSHEFPPRLGGAGTVALQLANYLITHGHFVTVVTEKRGHNIDYDFDLIEIPVISKLWFISYYFFFKVHDLNQYDKIFLNDGGAIYSAGLSFNDKALVKSIVYVHGEEKYLSENKFILSLINFKGYYIRTLEKSYKIISVSNFIKDIFFKDKLKKYLPKVQTIYNGVDTKQFYYKDRDVLVEYNLLKNQKILLSVSRFTKEKGYLTKLSIFKELLKDNKNYVWFIIGDGDFKDEFYTIVKLNNLEKKIYILGKKDKDELKYYYSQADFFWLLSDLEESFGLVYLEAMACKCIPIGWNRAGVMEVIKNNVSGCLANNKNEVIDFIEYKYKLIDREGLPKKVINVKDNYYKVLL